MRFLFFLFLLISFTLISAKNIILTYTPEENIDSVFIAGDFTHWKITPLNYDPAQKHFYYSINLPPGIYEYRFYANGRYFRDPSNVRFGGKNSNSILYIPGEEPIIKRVTPLIGSTISHEPFIVQVIFSSKNKINLNKSRLLVNKKIFKFELKNDSTLIVSLSNYKNHFLKFRIELIDQKNKKSLPFIGAWRLKTENNPPIAEAGYLYKAIVNHRVTLSGLHSTDPDFDEVTLFEWKILNTKKKNFTLLNDLHSAEPQLIFHQPGFYQLALRVFDGMEWSQWDTTTVWCLPDYYKTITFRFKKGLIGQDSIKKICLVGDFNHWKNNEIFFTPLNNFWKCSYPFKEGIYEYKFVINDKYWIADPTNPDSIEDGWNGYNSLLKIHYPDNFIRPDFEIRNLQINFHWTYEEEPEFIFVNDPNNQQKIHFKKNNKNLTIIPPVKNGTYYFYVQMISKNYFSPIFSFLLSKNKKDIEISSVDFSPSWIQSSILYEIFVPKFGEQEDSRNLRDIYNAIPYLKDLGINTLWLTPLYPSPSEHHYSPSDYFDVEPKFGGMHEYKSLITALHINKMKIFCDFVANHSGDQHPFFLSAYFNPNSYFRKFYRFKNNREYEYHNDWDQLPNLNYNSTIVRQYMSKVAKFWANLGVDGFRCDAAWGVPHTYWKFLRKELKQINPDLVLLDEVLPRDPLFHEDEFDMSYNTDLYGNILDYCDGKKTWVPILLNYMKDKYNFGPGASFLNYLENHDMPRFSSKYGNKETVFFAALTLLTSGIPMIYYGQEVGLQKMRDLFNPKQIATKDDELYNYYKALTHLRSKILKRGDLHLISNDSTLHFSNKYYHIIFNLTHRKIKLTEFQNYKIIQDHSQNTFLKKIWGNEISGKIILNPLQLVILKEK